MATPMCETEQPNKARLGKPPLLRVPTPPDRSKPRPMPKKFARSAIFWQPQRDWLAHTGPAAETHLSTRSGRTSSSVRHRVRRFGC